MVSDTVRNFMKQQGFADEPDTACGAHFAGLNFQPRIVAIVVVIGIVLQSPVTFLVLSAVLWMGVLLPKLNLFELVYNGLFANRAGKPALPPAPGPRRFAQGMAATFMLLTGIFLLQGWMIAAYVMEAFIVVAVSALLFGKLCLGSYVYHALRGRIAFANSTLPWAHPRA